MSDLTKKLSQGQLPLPGMMTANEVAEHFNLGDSPKLDDLDTALAGTPKSPRQKEADEEVLNIKLQDSKHSQSQGGGGTLSLYKDISKNGVQEPIQVWDNISANYNRRPEIKNGHHRLAVARHLNPNQFVNFKYW